VSDYFDRFERQMVRRVEAGVPRRRRFGLRVEIVAPAVSLLVVVAIVAVFLSVRGGRSSTSGAGGGIELVYRAEPTPQAPVTSDALARAIDLMRDRAQALHISGASFGAVGGNEISVRLPRSTNVARAASGLGTTARVEFYDWEANVLLPSGKTVASLGPALSTDQTALDISQGVGSVSPGSPGAWSMSLYDAVRLASKQPAVSDAQCTKQQCSRLGPVYYGFGEPGSAACGIAAKFYGYAPVPSDYCYLGGPDTTVSDLESSTASLGVKSSQVQNLAVPQGVVVLQAVPAGFSNPPKPYEPTTRFFVLTDKVGLFGNDISNPKAGTDPSGAPDVQFGFTSNGKTEFQNLTGQIARRGSLISPTAGSSKPLYQHFAVALDQQLISIPYIDFKQYPDGVPADKGGQISGDFTSTSASDLANQLRLGALPINLQLVSKITLRNRR
jgi:preprotein translocase subunit SecD